MPATATAETATQKKNQRPARGQDHGGGGLERVTVNLIPRASQALQEVSELTHDSKTDSINRAIQLYTLLEKIEQAGGKIYIQRPGDSQPTELVVL